MDQLDKAIPIVTPEQISSNAEIKHSQPLQEDSVQTAEELDAEIVAGELSIKQTKNRVQEIRAGLGLPLDENLDIPSIKWTEARIADLAIKKSRFTLTKPEGYGADKTKKISLDNLPVPPNSTFRELHRTGEKVTDDLGVEKVVMSANYDLGGDTKLHIRGRDYAYQSKSNPGNRLSSEYDKNTGQLVKMHFSSDNPYFSGKTIIDMVERIPPGTEILGGEVSMSTDSFPLLLNAVSKYLSKTPDRFDVSQNGEMELNDQGLYSDISKVPTVDEKMDMLNQVIDNFISRTKIVLSHARQENTEDGPRIFIPRVKIIKKY